MNKLLVTIIVVVGLTALYTLLSINDVPLPNATNNNAGEKKQQSNKQSIDQEIQNFKQEEGVLELDRSSRPQNSALSELPADFELKGIVFSKAIDKSYTALLVDNSRGEYFVDENIENLNVYVKKINKASIILEFESRDYELVLGEHNDLLELQTQQHFDEMTPTEIGSRPRQLNHIVETLPNLFNDGGKVIIPGMNPDLFTKARFQEGDVLLEVNGFEIDDDKQLSDLQREIRSAQTLTFKVNRAGRLITLYLDIPHEALKL